MERKFLTVQMFAWDMLVKSNSLVTEATLKLTT